MKKEDICRNHVMELQHQEMRDGRMKVVLGCSSCGKMKEYNLAITDKFANETKRIELSK